MCKSVDRHTFYWHQHALQDVSELLPASEESRPRSIRVNTIKVTKKEAVSRLQVLHTQALLFLRPPAKLSVCAHAMADTWSPPADQQQLIVCH